MDTRMQDKKRKQKTYPLKTAATGTSMLML